ncbi:hypothetical protein DQ393_21225 [Rhizobium tropici]|uniref:Uncharacterized protein n=1 Tax=Rhizobium tropici TaxID=398 RepID=A0A329YCM6_RHITR|nr:hypothetical protein DQ393_21225 [Rhizobium tropici]
MVHPSKLFAGLLSQVLDRGNNHIGIKACRCRKGVQRFCDNDMRKIKYLEREKRIRIDRSALSLTLCHISVAEIDGLRTFAEAIFSSKDGAGVAPRGFGWRARRRKR